MKRTSRRIRHSRPPAESLKLLDILVERFSEYDRKELYSFVMCSEIRVDGEIVRDPATPVRIDAQVELTRDCYVSRAGNKLAAALSAWRIDPSGLVWLDAGASTGGFTDALLQAGAAHVH